jgi:predicted Fe-Mo cluster-binding NifX family protein
VLNENNKMESKLGFHFGRSSHFAIYDTINRTTDIIQNIIDHSMENKTPVDQVMKYKPDMIFTLGIGKKAYDLFKQKNIIIKTGNYKILKEVIENINNLENIKESQLN